MKKQRNSYLIGAVVIVITLILASIIVASISINQRSGTKIKNNVTNEITTTTVEYNDLTIEDVDSAITTAVKKVENAVIGVNVKVVVNNNGKNVETDYSSGSGVIYKREEVKDGSKVVNYKYYCITNAHVVNVDEISSRITKVNVYAYLGYDDVEILANVVNYDVKADIALLTFEHYSLIQPVIVGDSSKLEKGQLVFALGNPEGIEYYGTTTFGVVSAPQRYLSSDTDGDGVNDFYGEYVQHDAAINAGNSGGGLFNLKGELVGINNMKLVSDKIENMSFAITSNVAYTIVTEYFEKGIEIVRPRFNVMAYEVRALSEAAIANNDEITEIPNIYSGDAPYGIYVSQINPGTISKTPIQVHDIILEINGTKITRTYVLNAKLNSLVNGFKVGETVTIKYYDHVTKTIKTTTAVLES